MSDTVVEFKKGSFTAQQQQVEDHFGELIDVVLRLRTVLEYFEPDVMTKSHEGPCNDTTDCDVVCEQVATMNLANSLLNRLDAVLVKLNLVQTND